MSFFENAKNFIINGGSFTDVAGNMNINDNSQHTTSTNSGNTNYTHTINSHNRDGDGTNMSSYGNWNLRPRGERLGGNPLPPRQQYRRGTPRPQYASDDSMEVDPSAGEDVNSAYGQPRTGAHQEQWQRPATSHSFSDPPPVKAPQYGSAYPTPPLESSLDPFSHDTRGQISREVPQMPHNAHSEPYGSVQRGCNDMSPLTLEPRDSIQPPPRSIPEVPPVPLSYEIDLHPMEELLEAVPEQIPGPATKVEIELNPSDVTSRAM